MFKLFLILGSICFAEGDFVRSHLSEEQAEKMHLTDQKTSITEKKEPRPDPVIQVFEKEHYSFGPMIALTARMPQFFPPQVKTDISVFGLELFRKASLDLSRASLQQRAVPDDYPLGPGDRLRIHVWNQSEDKTVSSVINSSGNIPFPLAGEIHVQGILKKDLGAHLVQKLSSFYKELQISFEIEELKQFPVFVTGESRSPGIAIADSLASVLQVLMATGGPSARGSLRHIQLLRAGKIVQEIDLYRFLLEGKLEKDWFLQPSDVLHIPVAKTHVALTGRVKRPAVYELKNGESVKNILEFCGGLEADANQFRIQIVRFGSDGGPSVQDLKALEAGSQVLRDGDIVVAREARTDIQNSVEITGHIYAPGMYQWVSGMTIKSLIEKAQGFRPDASSDTILVQRLLPRPASIAGVNQINSSSQYESFSVDAKSITTFYLQPRDSVVIYALTDTQIRPLVKIYGEVAKPGDFQIQKDTRLRDVLIRSQLLPSAHLGGGELSRQTKEGVEIKKFELSRVLNGDLGQNMILQPQDVISIFKDPRISNQGSIILQGEVRFPGTYIFQSGEKLSQVLNRAGFISQNGFLIGARFLRRSVQERQVKIRDEFIKEERKNLSNLAVKNSQRQAQNPEDLIQSQAGLEVVSEAVEKLATVEVEGRVNLDFRGIQSLKDLENSASDISLEDGDRFVVPVRPSEVIVAGQVYSPATLLYQKGLQIRDYLNQAGGLSENAYKSRIYLVKASGNAVPASVMSARNRQTVSSAGKDVVGLSLSVEAGDTIIVPTRFKRPENQFKETLDNVYKIAVSVGALGGLFN